MSIVAISVAEGHFTHLCSHIDTAGSVGNEAVGIETTDGIGILADVIPDACPDGVGIFINGCKYECCTVVEHVAEPFAIVGQQNGVIVTEFLRHPG